MVGAANVISRRTAPWVHNGMPLSGRGRAEDHSKYGKRSAAAVQCSGGLSGSRLAVLRAFVVGHRVVDATRRAFPPEIEPVEYVLLTSAKLLR